MSYSDESNKSPVYACNGSTVDFAGAFYSVSQLWCKVILIDDATEGETELTFGSEWSVTTTADSFPTGSWNVQTVTTYPAGKSIVILRDVPSNQTTGFGINRDYIGSTHETVLDKLSTKIGEHDELLSRTFGNPLADPDKFTSESYLEACEAEANNAAASASAASASASAAATSASNASTSETNAAASAAAAATSESNAATSEANAAQSALDAADAASDQIALELGNVTNDAQLKRAANDFNTFTVKGSPTSGDYLLIEDGADSGNKKYVDVANLPTGGGGEANTASNVGTGGVGIFKTKSGIDLQFKKLNAGSSKVTITDDVGNDEVDIDVAEGQLNHANIQNVGTNTHAQIDTHIASTANPHSVTKTQVGLGNVPDEDCTDAANIVSGTLDGDRLPVMSTTKKGGVPPTGTPTGKYLTDGATWASPAIQKLGTDNLFYIEDQKTSGTAGGGASAATWNVRTLNTSVLNNISGASLSSNQITLAAGTYYVEASAPATSPAIAAVNQLHKLRLRNTTDASTTAVGTSETEGQNASERTQTRSFLTAVFTIGASKVFELQHYTSQAAATDGLGLATSASVSEVYAQIKIWKVS